ncbi:hypothetical protein [Polyangium aurulentum]|uniref:hypothetical protein n=1 Tax=Polyangium aurulentum TaxID=2567896 RepID=UPI0019807F1D|nr:hypothetical protein [Polyangium aurulentum]UQA62339.1 hypothetical protein E8A73_018475 [Polyangium aurulentum]
MRPFVSDPARIVAAVVFVAGMAATGGCGQILGLDQYQVAGEGGGGGAAGNGGGGGAGGASCEVKGCGEVVWSKAFGDNSAQEGMAVAADGQGNIWLCGSYPGDLSLGNSQVMGGDSFIAKFNPQGDAVWVDTIGGAGNSVHCNGIALDSLGSVVVIGSFGGALELGGAQHVASGNTDGFVAKLGPDGAHLWSRRTGDVSAATPFGVAVDPYDNVVVTGRFESSIGGVLSAGGDDVFVAKLSKINGNSMWTRGFGSTGMLNESGGAIAADSMGNVLVTGKGGGQIDFGGGPLPCGALLSPRVFMIKLDGSGNHAWSKCYGNQQLDGLSRLAVDAQNNVYLAGDFGGVVNFGGGDFQSSPGSDGFLAKFGPEGVHLWSKQFGTAPADDGVSALDVDVAGNVLVALNFESTIDVGDVHATSVGKRDMFLAKLDASGELLWGRAFGDPAEQHVAALVVDPSTEGPIITGAFGGTVDFGDGPHSADWGGLALFLAKFNK